MFYFIRLLSRARFFRISFSLLSRPFFLVVANPFPHVSVPFRPSHSASRHEPPPPSRGGAPFVEWAREEGERKEREREYSFFCYFIQLFRAREESFYYLGARLQCLADNKPMKATFEPESPLKSPFSLTSRFLSLSLSLPPLLSFSTALILSRVPIPSVDDSVPLSFVA